MSLNGRCATCAFRPGTDASRDDTTMLTVRLCLIAGEPFHCHEGEPGEYRPICAGFADALAQQPAHPAWRKAVATELLRVMEEGGVAPDDLVARILAAGESADATTSLTLRVLTADYTVTDWAHASRTYMRVKDAWPLEPWKVPYGEIRDGSGELVGQVSRNGCVWAPGDLTILPMDNPKRPALLYDPYGAALRAKNDGAAA